MLAAARLALAGAQACLDRLPPPPRDAAAATLWQRPDLLLDGWRLLVPAWSAAAREERAEALATMAAHLPIPPLEADAWPGAAGAWDPVLRLRRSLGPQPRPPQGLPDLVARNERLLAVAA